MPELSDTVKKHGPTAAVGGSSILAALAGLVLLTGGYKTKVDTLDGANLPTRVTRIEEQMRAFDDRLDHIDRVLEKIDTKQDQIIEKLP